MKFSDDMRFPHPVLTYESGDFDTGAFSVELFCEESKGSDRVALQYRIELTEPSLLNLVENGRARVCLFVRCLDTYYAALHPLNWQSGRLDFKEGALVNRVTIRPLIILNQSLRDWKLSGVHPEFGTTISLESGAILAVDFEYVINVGQAKLVPMESIFTIKPSPDLRPTAIQVSLEHDKITIFVGLDAFAIINNLRTSGAGKNATLNAIYLPAVMEVLDGLRTDSEAFSDRRWKEPFKAKCEHLGIDVSGSLFENAQLLLNHPVGRLNAVAEKLG